MNSQTQHPRTGVVVQGIDRSCTPGQRAESGMSYTISLSVLWTSSRNDPSFKAARDSDPEGWKGP